VYNNMVGVATEVVRLIYIPCSIY